MSDDELRRENEERQRLINEINRAVAEYNAEVARNKQLQIELVSTQEQLIESINYSKGLAVSFIPIINHCADEVEDVRVALDDVKNSIVELGNRYTTIKNISTATKNLTQCDDEYERKFRLYNKFRKVCLGYVIGIDLNIINNESLRSTLEKNYLANSDYWLASCIMSVMLWVSDEKDASMRAMNRALETDAKRSTIFFLLVNLRFGRVEAAKKWYNLYMDDIDVNDIGDEWQYLLQAYLYKAFGSDLEFEKKINEEYQNLLTEVKKYSINYESEVIKKVANFADAYPHKTNYESNFLQKYCNDYNILLTNLTNIEKMTEIAKYYNQILETNPKALTTLSRRIEDILYNLINSYDAEEYEIIKKIKFNEYIVKAKGDISQASKMYNQDIAQDGKLALIDLIYKFAFANLSDNIDNLVRRFAIEFLLDSITKGYEQYYEIISKNIIDKPSFTIDGCEFKANPLTVNEARVKLNTYYDKSKSKYIKRDKKHKIFTITWIVGVMGIIGSMLAMIVPTVVAKNNGNDYKVPLISLIFLVTFILLTGLFLVLSLVRRKKVLEKLQQKREQSLKTLNSVMDELQQFQNNYKQMEQQAVVLNETLEKFRK